MARETGPERHERHLRIARGTNKTLKFYGFHAQPMRRLQGGYAGVITEPKPTLRTRGPKQRVTSR